MKKRMTYDSDFKKHVVEMALQRPPDNRIKPTCALFPGIEPCQLRKWIRNYQAQQLEVSGGKPAPRVPQVRPTTYAVPGVAHPHGVAFVPYESADTRAAGFVPQAPLPAAIAYVQHPAGADAAALTAYQMPPQSVPTTIAFVPYESQVMGPEPVPASLATTMQMPPSVQMPIPQSSPMSMPVAFQSVPAQAMAVASAPITYLPYAAADAHAAATRATTLYSQGPPGQTIAPVQAVTPVQAMAPVQGVSHPVTYIQYPAAGQYAPQVPQVSSTAQAAQAAQATQAAQAAQAIQAAQAPQAPQAAQAASQLGAQQLTQQLTSQNATSDVAPYTLRHEW